MLLRTHFVSRFIWLKVHVTFTNILKIIKTQSACIAESNKHDQNA